jgi:hypothetical protein
MYLKHEHYPVCFGHTCMSDEAFLSIVIAMVVGILFSLPIVLALS